MAECRWEWCRPDKSGLWYWGGVDDRRPLSLDIVTIRNPDDWSDCVRWWAYIGPLPPEPLPPKKKVTQTLWMVPAPWQQSEVNVFFQRWLSPDDTIPPGSKQTVETREVEL